jgi:hypothetical protein
MDKSNLDNTLIIGFTGEAQAGKDTAASLLTGKFGFRRIAFADTMREMLYRLNPIVVLEQSRVIRWVLEDRLDYRKTEGRQAVGYDSDENVGFIRLADLIDAAGWDTAKEAPEVRQLMQRMGTEAGRDLFGENFWVDFTFKKIKAEDHAVAFTDVRFDNEAEEIVANGGHVIKIVSDRTTKLDTPKHSSENGISPHLIDFVVENNGTIEELHAQIAKIVGDAAMLKANKLAAEFGSSVENFLAN